ncbi:hypothetical protein ACFFK0_06885 [Paenibacillus chartarius]|uniref:Spore germination GerAC-like C-terminal domain-containing protein n=1 Tax=Paenibacillus chartarius TaxID=747481 RepID=A0ABV6DHU3_9BACL
MPANAVFMFFGRTGTETSYVVSEYLFNFRRRMVDKGFDAMLPNLEPRAEQVRIVVQLHVTGVIEEAITAVENSRMGEYKQFAEEILRKDMTKLMEKIQQQGIDPVGSACASGPVPWAIRRHGSAGSSCIRRRNLR